MVQAGDATATGDSCPAPQDCVTAPGVTVPEFSLFFFLMEIKSKIVHRCPSVKGNALSCTNRMYRFHTYVRMVQDLHYSYFPKQLLRKDKTYCCLKNRKPQTEVTWNSILKQSLAYKTAGSGREPKRRPSSQLHSRIVSHETQPSVLTSWRPGFSQNSEETNWSGLSLVYEVIQNETFSSTTLNVQKQRKRLWK